MNPNKHPWNSRNHWARVFVLLNGLAFLGIGGSALLWPHAFGSFAGGIKLTTPAAVTDFRAVYGGLQLALATALLVCTVLKSLVRPGLFLSLLAVSGLAFGRVYGMAANGSVDHRSSLLLVPEVLGAAMNGCVCLWLARSPQSRIG